MKLRNKKTGEIVPASNIAVGIGKDGEWYDSLAELNEEWEDYEEPKEFFAISPYRKDGYELFPYDNFEHIYELAKELGIAFETKEEAEKAVEKLKAWKRLKDKGFRFDGWKDTNIDLNDILFELPYMEWDKNVIDDLDSLFGDEK